MDEFIFKGDMVQTDRVLHTPSIFAKNNLIYLQETGILTALKPHINQREKLNSFLFFIVLSGYGSITYEDKTIPLKVGQCVFIDCQKPYAHSTSVDNLWTLRWVHFYGPHMDKIYEKYISRGGKYIFQTNDISKFDNLLISILDVSKRHDPVRDMKLYAMLVNLLTLLMEEDSISAKTDEPVFSSRDKLVPVKNYIDKNFTENIHLNDLTDHFYINKFYLSRIFKEQFGISINSYIINQRITKAKGLLRFSENSIDEVSRLCGIDDPGYFIRMFKKVEGVTPGAYRKQWTKTN